MLYLVCELGNNGAANAHANDRSLTEGFQNVADFKILSAGLYTQLVLYTTGGSQCVGAARRH